MTRFSGSEKNGAAAVMVDTNVLLYSHDLDAAEKREKAITLVDALISQGHLVLTAQVLNEFFSNATRSRKRQRAGKVLLSREAAAEVVRGFCRAVPIVPVTASVTQRALDVHFLHSLSFWDALIWAAAKEN